MVVEHIVTCPGHVNLEVPVKIDIGYKPGVKMGIVKFKMGNS
jgi:hypothetical protein